MPVRNFYFALILTSEMEPVSTIFLDCNTSSAKCTENGIQYTFVCSVSGESLQWKSDLFDYDIEFYEMDPFDSKTEKSFNATLQLLENSTGKTSQLVFMFNESFAGHILTCTDSSQGESDQCTIPYGTYIFLPNLNLISPEFSNVAS